MFNCMMTITNYAFLKDGSDDMTIFVLLLDAKTNYILKLFVGL